MREREVLKGIVDFFDTYVSKVVDHSGNDTTVDISDLIDEARILTDDLVDDGEGGYRKWKICDGSTGHVYAPLDDICIHCGIKLPRRVDDGECTCEECQR